MPEPIQYPRLSLADQGALLRRVVEICGARREGQAAPAVVFDLDGTLMDNRPRTCAILHELAADIGKTNPALAERLRIAVPEALDYLLTDTLARLGVTQSDDVAVVQSFWRDRFFADEHMKHDIALPGAVSFAHACYEAGGVLVYMTGRDLPLMGIGSFKSLRDLGFPIGVAGTELVLKPDANMPDEAFKRLTAPKVARIGHVVAAFDNEPANCNVFLNVYPDSISVLVDTQHLPGAPALAPGVRVIRDFAM